MKIGILTNSYPAYKGHLQSPFIHELAKALAKENEVKVVCPYYGKFSKKKEIVDGVEIRRFQYFPLRFQKLTEGGGMPSSLKASFIAKLNMPFFMISSILKSVKELRKCEVIHCQWTLSGVSGIFVKYLFRKPMILTTRGADLTLKNNLFKTIIKFIFERCDFITPNNEDHVKIIEEMGIPKEKIFPIPNGIDIESFKPRNKNVMRNKFNLPSDKKIILFVGWLIERKGVNYLLDAASKIVKVIPDTLFIIIGNGILEEQLKSYSCELGLREYVMFLGAKSSEEIPYWMNAADIFVLSSLSEGRPNVVAEASSSGLPVIATEVNGTPEIVEDSKTGFLIPSKDSDAIYNKLKILLENKKLRENMGKNGRKFILKKGYTWEKCALNYIEIYRRLV